MADKLLKIYIKNNGYPDIIHSHNFLFAGVIGDYFKRKYNIKFIVTEHSSIFFRNKLSNISRNAIRKVSSNASLITAVSNSLVIELKKIISVQICVLSNILDNSYINLDININRTNKFYFLNIAHLNNNKNQELLIRSFKKISLIFPNVFLKIGGNGPMFNSLKNLISKLELDNRVTLLGFLTSERVREEMLNSDCFVLSSNFETFGVVLIEAMSCGLPLIATKCGGPEDIVNPDNGILIDVGNQLQLERALQYMVVNIDKYIKEDIRSECNNKFGEKNYLSTLYQIYNKIIANEK